MQFSIVQVIGLAIIVVVATVFFYDRHQRKEAEREQMLMAETAVEQQPAYIAQPQAEAPAPRKPAPPKWQPQDYRSALVISDFSMRTKLVNSEVQGVIQNTSSHTAYHSITMQIKFRNNAGKVIKVKEHVLELSIYPREAKQVNVLVGIPIAAISAYAEVISAEPFNPAQEEYGD